VRAVTGATEKSIPITQGAKPANIVEVLAGAVWGQPAQRVSAETSWPSRADGMVKLAESFLADHHVSGSAGERFQVMVHLDQDVLDPDGAWSSGTLEDGTHVSAETLRRVACDCGLVAVGHDGQALNIGRRARSIPPAIRRALMLRDHGCAFPGCTHTRFLHAHHLQHWLHGGATSLDNLVMLCSLCLYRHKLHYADYRIMPTCITRPAVFPPPIEFFSIPLAA